MTSVPDPGFGGRAASLAADLRRKRAELEEQQKELSGLAKQTAQELDRAAQRAREAIAQIRQVESNFAGMSQSDIKRAYSAVQEAQMRQFMMQTQLDQQRNRLASLDSNDEFLRQLMDAASELTEMAEDRTGSDSSAQATSSTDQSPMGHESAQATFRSIELALQRLSRQLQDQTAQTLSDLILRAEVCERLVEVDKQKGKTEIARLKQAASAALRSTRHLVQELRSPALEEADLATAVRRYVDSLKGAGKLQVELQIAGLDRRIPQPIELATFRVIQEALANAAAHSGAGRAEVRIRYDGGHLTATVADEGTGFDVEKAHQVAQSREHSGLAEMEQRAELVGGELEISSKPGSGCVVSLAVPA